jgi:hypothetical protein
VAEYNMITNKQTRGGLSRSVQTKVYNQYAITAWTSHKTLVGHGSAVSRTEEATSIWIHVEKGVFFLDLKRQCYDGIIMRLNIGIRITNTPSPPI